MRRRASAALPPHFFLGFEDLGFGGIEDAIKVAEDGHGEHDFAILGRTVGTAEGIGDVPDDLPRASILTAGNGECQAGLSRCVRLAGGT